MIHCVVNSQEFQLYTKKHNSLYYVQFCISPFLSSPYPTIPSKRIKSVLASKKFDCTAAIESDGNTAVPFYFEW